MKMRRRMGYALCGCGIVAGGAHAAIKGSTKPPQERVMPALIEQYSADLESIEGTYVVRTSAVRSARLVRFDNEKLAMLEKLDFDAMTQEDKVDYLLLRNKLTADLHQLAIQKRQVEEMRPLLPFADTIEGLLEQKRLMQRPDAEKVAAALTAMVKQMKATEAQLDPKKDGGGAANPVRQKVSPVAANRAMLATKRLSHELDEWYGQYNGYDPSFTWWVDQPYKDAQKALASYSDFLKEKLIGIAPEDKTTIIGDPVGRDALLAQLNDDMISYTPEELIAIAQTEYDWCMREMLKASREMGYGEDWHAAVEKVKQMHVAPGDQPLGQSAAAVFCDAVIAPGRSHFGGFDPAAQKSRCRQRPQHGIDGALLEDRRVIALAFQLHRLGDFIAVHFPVGLLQHQQQHQGGQPGHQLLAKLAAMVGIQGGSLLVLVRIDY